LAKDCRSLLRFDLKDIAPMPAGFPRIDVRFLIDANGILNVTARDARTGKEQSIEVKPSYGLTLEQTEAMIDDAIAHGEEDLNAAQVALVRVDADAILLAIEKARRNDAWLALSDPEREQIDSAIRELQTVYHSDDHHAIHDRIDVLNEVTHQLAENMMNTAVSAALKGTKV
jgi:molecular chaperone DnaK (HSP70)